MDSNPNKDSGLRSWRPFADGLNAVVQNVHWNVS